MEQQQINDIIEKYKQGIASPAELEQLNNWYRDNAYLDAEYPDSEHEVYDRIITRLNSKINPVQRRTRLWPRIAAAAAILLVAGLGVFFYTSYYAPRHLDNRRDLLNYANDITPGKNTATITLANGKTIQLSDAKTGVIIDAASLKYNDGSAVGTGDARYLDDRRDPLNSTGKRSFPGGRDDEKAEMTSVATPRGGQYQITLPDGTKVWLNAASNLSFPSTFKGLGNRKVELSGEAYFEVAKDKAHPFIVATDKQEVEVLGTHFNINSYADETATKTTLLEGSVRVSLGGRHRHLDDRRDLPNRTNNGSLPAGRDDGARRDDGQSAAIILKPNQQSVLTGNSQLKVENANVNDAIAWKNGVFKFNNTTLESIMRQLARWYNIDVVYKGDVTKETFNGVIDRKANLSRILKILEKGGVSFKIEGKKLTVIP